MNYTDAVREYCYKHKNEILEVARLKEFQFEDIPYKTLLRIMNRLEEEQIITGVSKGIYYVGEKLLSEPKLISHFTDDGKGMIVGYALYNEIGLTDYQDDKIEIYTNAIAANKHNIGRISLNRVDLPFDGGIDDLVALLEIIEAGSSIKKRDKYMCDQVEKLLCQSYSDELFGYIIKAINYKYSTIIYLDKLLTRNFIPHRCLEIFVEP